MESTENKLSDLEKIRQEKKQRYKLNNSIKSILEMFVRFGHLKIDNSFIVEGVLVEKIKSKLTDLNKRTERRFEKGLINENKSIEYSENKLSDSLVANKIKSIIKNPINYKGRVLMGSKDLFDEDDGLNGDIIYVLKEMNKIMNDEKYGHPLDRKFSVLDFENLKINHANGWSVLGVIKSSEGSYSVFPFGENSEDKIPDKFFNLDEDDCKNCDHCQKKRERNDVFILENEDSKQILQVGGSCIKDFVDTKELKEVLKIHEAFQANMSGTYHREVDVYSKEEFIAKTFASMESTGGYLIDSDIFSYGTKSRVIYSLSDNKREDLMRMLEKNLIMAKTPRSEIKETLHKVISQFDIDAEEKHYQMAQDLIQYYKDNSKELIQETKNHHKRNMILKMSSNSLYIDLNHGQVGYYSVAVKEEFERLSKKNDLDNLKNGKKEISINPPKFLGKEKTKFENITGQIIGIKEKIFENFYDSTLSYEFTLKTPEGIIFRASTSALDKFSEKYNDERGYIMEPPELFGKFKDHYITISGSISGNVSFVGDENRKIEYSKLRINSISDPINPEDFNPELGVLELKEKVSILNLKLNEIESGIVIKGADVFDVFQYNWVDSKGVDYVLHSSVDLDLKEGKNYSFPSLINSLSKDVKAIMPVKKENVVEIDGDLVDNKFDEKYTKKQAEKKLGLGKKPKTKVKVKK